MVVTDNSGMEFCYTQGVKSATLENGVIIIRNSHHVAFRFWKASNGFVMFNPDLGGALSDKDFDKMIAHFHLKNYRDV